VKQIPICEKLLSGDFSPDDLGGDIGTMSLRNPDGPEAAAIINEFRDLLIETQDTIRDAANGGEPRFGDLWRKIDAALTRAQVQP
jgi:hypothetical protein